MSKKYSASPCKKFAVAVEPSWHYQDLYVAEHYVDDLLLVYWHTDEQHYELFIDYHTAREFTPDVERPPDNERYLKGVEYEAIVEYREQLQEFLPRTMSEKLDKFLLVYEMGLL